MPTGFAAGTTAVVALGWTESNGVGVGGELWQSADGLSWAPANAPMVPPPPQAPGGPCPAVPTLQQLIDIGTARAASCYGQASLTVRAYSSDCGGCGGIVRERMTPGWIGQIAFAPWYVSPVVTAPGGPGPRLPVYLLPSAHLTPPNEGAPVIITGHFNDVASQGCRMVPLRAFLALGPMSDAVAACGRSFVVTSITAGS